MVLLPVLALAAPGDDVPAIQLSLAGGMTEPDKVSLALEILFLLTVLSLAPAIMMTRNQLYAHHHRIPFRAAGHGDSAAAAHTDSGQSRHFHDIDHHVPVGREINDTALQPYLAEQIDFNEALDRAQVPLRSFMFKHTREKDISIFYSIAKMDQPRSKDEVPTTMLAAAMCSASLKPGSASVFSFIFPFLLLTWWCPASCLPWV